MQKSIFGYEVGQVRKRIRHLIHNGRVRKYVVLRTSAGTTVDFDVVSDDGQTMVLASGNKEVILVPRMVRP